MGTIIHPAIHIMANSAIIGHKAGMQTACQSVIECTQQLVMQILNSRFTPGKHLLSNDFS